MFSPRTEIIYNRSRSLITAVSPAIAYVDSNSSQRNAFSRLEHPDTRYTLNHDASQIYLSAPQTRSDSVCITDATITRVNAPRGELRERSNARADSITLFARPLIDRDNRARPISSCNELSPQAVYRQYDRVLRGGGGEVPVQRPRLYVRVDPSGARDQGGELFRLRLPDPSFNKAHDDPIIVYAQLVEPEVYQQHLAKSIAQAENNAGNQAFHCKTPDCPGWCIYDDDVNNFLCPVCGANNCLTCQVSLHTSENEKINLEELILI